MQETNPTPNESNPAQPLMAKTPLKPLRGVRSYLHNFYEAQTPSEYRYLIAPSKKKRSVYFWRFSLGFGINLLVLGLLMILIGYLLPRRPIIIGHEDQMEIIDKNALKFNGNLEICKLIGLVVFCIGGTFLVGVLLFPSMTNYYCDMETLDGATEPFKVTLKDDLVSEEVLTPEEKVPATEELSNVQPKSEEAVVVTQDGLHKVS